MRLNRSQWPLSAVLLLSSLASAAPLTLPEAIQMAWDHSPLLDSARQTQTLRSAERANAQSKVLPSLDLTTTHGLQEPSPTSPWTSQFQLGLTEVLYDNGASLTQIKAANLRENLAELAFLKTRDELSLGVVTEFYDYSLATTLLEVRRQQQNVLARQFRSITERYEQGLQLKSDYLRFKSQVQRAEIDSLDGENAVELSATRLRTVLGLPPETSPLPTFAALAPPDPSRALPTETPLPRLEQTYEFRTVQIQKQLDETAVNLVDREYWPRVSLRGGLTYQQAHYLPFGNSTPSPTPFSAQALITLDYNLWDWGIRRRNVAIAQQNQDIAANTYRQSLLDTQASIRRLEIELIRSRRNYGLNRELLQLETESHQSLAALYREGKVDYLNYVSSLNDLLNARVQFYSAYFGTLRGLAQLKYFEGKIHELVTSP